MHFTALPLSGAYEIRREPQRDGRGLFTRRFSAALFAERGLATGFAECSLSQNQRRGTLRGLHFQQAPYAETKLVRCARGAAYDVIADLRRGSPTFGRWHACEISAANHLILYIPAGFAHGFQTLRDDTEIDYAITPAYRPEAARGIRHDDPDLAIRWPLPAGQLSPRDLSLPSLAQALQRPDFPEMR